ncbi:MAG: class I SAM-dependent methyltransferase [Cyclobacteriaceae bacterium]
MQKDQTKIPENTSKNTHNVVASLVLDDKDCHRVLDIPSGAGAFTQRMLQQNKEIYSADIENMMMVENPHFQQADMNHRLPFEDDFFCAVACIDGIEHLERPFDFVRECCRVLKKGGSLIVSTPNISALRSRWRWMLTGHHNKCKTPLDETNPTPLHHINMFSYPRLRYVLHSNGFQIDRVTTNRVKGVSYLYFPWIPFSYVKTSAVYRKEEKDPDQRNRNKAVQQQMFAKPLLFGETMIIRAKKI